MEPKNERKIFNLGLFGLNPLFDSCDKLDEIISEAKSLNLIFSDESYDFIKKKKSGLSAGVIAGIVIACVVVVGAVVAVVIILLLKKKNQNEEEKPKV